MKRPKWLEVILACFLGLTGVASLQGQQAVEHARRALLCRQTRFLQFPISLSGDLELNSEPPGEAIPTIEFFVHPIIVDELNLSGETVERIRDLFDDCTARAAKMAREPPRKGDRSEGTAESELSPSSGEDAILRCWDEFFENVDSCLSDEQANRLRQLQWQFLLYRNGIVGILCHPKVAEAIGISPDALDKSRAELEQVARDVLSTEQELTEELIAKWLGKLDEGQQRVFASFWKAKFQKPGSLGHLAWSFAYEKWSPMNGRADTNVSLLMYDIPQMLHGADGNLWTDRKAEERRRQKLSEVERLYALQHFLNSEFVKRLGEFNDNQISEIARIDLDFRDTKSKIVFDVLSELDVPILDIQWHTLPDGTEHRQVSYDWPEDRSQIDREIEVKLGPVATSFREQLENVLLPHQLDGFRRIEHQVEAHMRGPLADLEKGFLGERMELSDADRGQLSESAKQVLELLEVKSRQTRDEVLEKLLGYFSSDDREALKSIIGRPVQRGHCDLRNLAVTLRMASRERDSNTRDGTVGGDNH